MARKPTAAQLKIQKAYEELYIEFYAPAKAWAEARVAQGLAVYDPQAAEYMARVVKERKALADHITAMKKLVEDEKQADKDALK